MKKIVYFILFLCLFTKAVNAQNALPDSGRVGIGTRNPVDLLTIKAPSIAYDTATATTNLQPHFSLTNFAGQKKFELRVNNNGSTISIGLNAGRATMGKAGSNTFIGAYAGLSTTTGSANTFIGNSTGLHNLTGNYSTFIGFGAGQLATNPAYDNFIGAWSGYNTTTGTYNNFFGAYAGMLNTTGVWNTYVGHSAGYSNNGSNNTIVGMQAGYNLLTGSGNAFLGTNAGRSATAGLGNLVLGGQAAATGAAASQLTTGSQNIVIGYQAGLPDGTLSNQLSIGNLIYGTGLNGTGGTISTGNIGIGTTSPDEKLTVYGNIHARGVKVDLNGPLADYVFESDYKLKPLSELKDYLKANHHLPEIPSAQQAEKEGLDLGKMNQLLLKKVEELTLYLIKKDKEDKVKQKQIDQLKKSNALINKKLQVLNVR